MSPILFLAVQKPGIGHQKPQKLPASGLNSLIVKEKALRINRCLPNGRDLLGHLAIQHKGSPQIAKTKNLKLNLAQERPSALQSRSMPHVSQMQSKTSTATAERDISRQSSLPPRAPTSPNESTYRRGAMPATHGLQDVRCSLQTLSQLNCSSLTSYL